MELQGRIKKITPVQTFGDNGFRKRELIITTEEQYPQSILIEFTQGNCDQLNSFHEGEIVKVDFSIRGREWQSPQGEIKYFNSLNGWRITHLEATPSAAPQSSTPPPVAPITPEKSFATHPATPLSNDLNDDGGDLPF